MKQRGGRFYFSRSILENVAILYIFFALALLSLVYFAGTGDINTTAVFVISGFVISFFSKNMTVIFILTLVISHIYKYGMDNMRISKENLENLDDNSKYKQLEDKPLFNGSKLDINDMKSKINTQNNILSELIPKVNDLKIKDEISSTNQSS